jgi:hypothetical protein
MFPYHTAGKTIKLKIEQKTGCFLLKFIYGTSLMGQRLMTSSSKESRSQESESRIQGKSNQNRVFLNYWLLLCNA